jgi:hypothetical protein
MPRISLWVKSHGPAQSESESTPVTATVTARGNFEPECVCVGLFKNGYGFLSFKSRTRSLIQHGTRLQPELRLRLREVYVNWLTKPEKAPVGE